MDFKYSLEESIGFVSKNLAKAIGTRLMDKLKEKGIKLTIEQWITLTYLWHFSGQNQNEIGHAINMDKTAVTRLLGSMENMNLVIRVNDKSDRRNNLIILTQKGKDLYQEIVKYAEETISEACVGIPENEIEIFKKTSRKMLENLQNLKNV